MIRRRLKLGHQYRILEVAHTTDTDLLHCLVRIQAQLPDAHLPSGFSSVIAIGLDGRYMNQTVYVQGRLQLHLKSMDVCICSGYNWPHRLGSGKCFHKETL